MLNERLPLISVTVRVTARESDRPDIAGNCPRVGRAGNETPRGPVPVLSERLLYTAAGV